MPDFEPNEYLFKTHADKGQERWEIYAWAIREIIMECGNMQSSDMPYRVKQVYCRYMNQAKNAIHPDDLTEEIPPPELLKDEKSLKFIQDSANFY